MVVPHQVDVRPATSGVGQLATPANCSISRKATRSPAGCPGGFAPARVRSKPGRRQGRRGTQSEDNSGLAGTAGAVTISPMRRSQARALSASGGAAPPRPSHPPRLLRRATALETGRFRGSAQCRCSRKRTPRPRRRPQAAERSAREAAEEAERVLARRASAPSACPRTPRPRPERIVPRRGTPGPPHRPRRLRPRRTRPRRRPHGRRAGPGRGPRRGGRREPPPARRDRRRGPGPTPTAAVERPTASSSAAAATTDDFVRLSRTNSHLAKCDRREMSSVIRSGAQTRTSRSAATARCDFWPQG